MPFALITIGVVIFATALNGTFRPFGSQLYKDLFTNSPPFIYWAAALVVVGLIGYIPQVKKPADWFMVLIIVGIILANGGFFTQLQQALANPQGINPGGGTTSTAASNAAGTTGVNLNPLQNAQLQLDEAMGQVGGANYTPVTTPQPVSGGTPLGFGGIGSA